MANPTIRERGVGLLVGGVGLIVLGLVWTMFGARTASLEVCSPPSKSCEVMLQVDRFFADFYGPNGLCIAIGVVSAVAGFGLVRWSKRATSG